VKLSTRIGGRYGPFLWLSSMLFGAVVSFAVALVSWNLLEKRFLRLKGRFAPQFRAG
jgi:peptidoglycan/LPS O-acetylase OafA/YrhL